MRKILISLLLCVLVASSASAVIFLRRAGGGGGDCPSGTYKFYWNGDHSSGDDYACTNSGAGTKQWATASGGSISANGYDGDSFNVTANNQYREWSVSADDIFSEDTGTICARFWVDSSVDDECVILESEYNNDGANYIVIYVEAADTVMGKQEGNNSAIYARSDGDTVTLNNWNYFCYRWNTSTHGMSLNGAAWDDDSESAAWVQEPNDLTLGENESGVNFTENCRIDEVYIFGTYETDNNPYD